MSGIETGPDQEQEPVRQNSPVQVFSATMTEDVRGEDNSATRGMENLILDQGSRSGLQKGKERESEEAPAGEPEKSKAMLLPEGWDEYSRDQLIELLKRVSSGGISKYESKREKSGSGNEER